MDTFKNFFVGLAVLILSAIILFIVMLAWPILMGIGSFLMSIVAIILFVILIFYIIVLVGHITRRILTKK